MNITYQRALELFKTMQGPQAEFRAGQWEAVQHLLNQRNTLVVMPTGSGKSLIYQLAALLLDENRRPSPTALVISPLIALMKDQVDGLERRGIPATFINSTLSTSEQNIRLRSLAIGKYKIVYVAPERLRNSNFLDILRRQTISLLAVDEAHCISEWGHDFRPDYLQIAAVRKGLGSPLTAALTATATPDVQTDIIRLLGLSVQDSSTEKTGQVACVITGFNRPNLMLQVRYASQPQVKLRLLNGLLAETKQGAIIIYAGTRREAEEICAYISDEAHLKAEYYHAGLDSDRRNFIQDTFINGKVNIVVATNAFGMGIDRPDVRLVVHYNMPGSLEAYYQEAGRAGRDGLPARAVLLYDPKDRSLQEYFIDTNKITLEEMRNLYDAVKSSNSSQAWLTTQDLFRLTKISESKLKIILAELERAGALQRLGDEGMRMLIRCGAWNPLAITAAVEMGKNRFTYRKAQLDKMVGYAESTTCRRRILLDHFGDRGNTDGSLCCDNCSRSKAQNISPAVIQTTRHIQLSTANPAPREDVVTAIIECVRSLPGQVPPSGIAKLLVGSDSERVQIYRQHPLFNCLSGITRGAVLDQIEHMLQTGQLILNEHNDVIIGSVHREKGLALPTNESHSVGRIVALGNSKSKDAVLELIDDLKSPNGNKRRLAASALGKIGDIRAVEPLMKLLSNECKPQVRQYAVKALGKHRDSRARSLLLRIAEDLKEKDYTRTAARNALKLIRSKR